MKQPDPVVVSSAFCVWEERGASKLVSVKFHEEHAAAPPPGHRSAKSRAAAHAHA